MQDVKINFDRRGEGPLSAPRRGGSALQSLYSPPRSLFHLRWKESNQTRCVPMRWMRVFWTCGYRRG